MTGYTDTLREQLGELERAREGAVQEYTSAQIRALELKAQADQLDAEYGRLEEALAILEGKPVPTADTYPTTDSQSTGPERTVPEKEAREPAGAQEVAGPAPKEAAAPAAPQGGLIQVASEIPGPQYDPNSKVAQEGWVQGPDGRFYEPGQVRNERQLEKDREVERAKATAQGPKCPACGRRGTLQQMQHASGRIMTSCSGCGNQIW